MNTEAKVGAFVLISTVILLGTIYAVTGMQIGRTHVLYRTYLRYAGGMQPGADVLFGGIKVGSVKSVRPDLQDPTRIEILMEVEQGTPLNTGSVAKLGYVSMLSSPVMSISMGSNRSPRLPPDGVIASQETISLDDTQRKIVALADSAEGLLTAVHKDVDDITGDARKLMSNLNDLTGKPNQQRVASILTNADTMVTHLSPKIDLISDQVVKLTGDANTLVTKLSPLVDNVNATVANANGTITSIREPLQSDLSEMHSTLQEARGLMGEVRGSLRAKDQDVSDTLDNVRAATDNLKDLTESVKERPWSLVRIKQPKDRKVPK